MAPRQTARRLLVAAPALALAFAVTACSPPNEQPADPDAPYTLPTYTGDADAPETETEVEAEDVDNDGVDAGIDGSPDGAGSPEGFGVEGDVGNGEFGNGGELGNGGEAGFENNGEGVVVDDLPGVAPAQ